MTIEELMNDPLHQMCKDCRTDEEVRQKIAERNSEIKRCKDILKSFFGEEEYNKRIMGDTK